MHSLFESLSFPRLKSFSIEFRLHQGTSARSRSRSAIAAGAGKEGELVEENEDENLCHLLDILDHEIMDITEDDFGPFIERHSTTLTTLSIELIGDTQPPTLQWMTQCRLLKRFDLSVWSEVPWLDYVRIWRSCPLVTMQLKAIVPSTTFAIADTKRMREMDDAIPIKELTLSLTGVPLDQQLLFIMLCAPTLEDLRWYSMPRPKEAAAFLAQAIKDGHLPRLTKLAMRDPTPNDQSLAEVVAARHPLGFQRLDFGSSATWVLTWKALHNSPVHLNSLQSLLLSHGTTSFMVSEMLQSLPNLREFSARTLIDDDVYQNGIASRPWVCLRLESLDITINVFRGKIGHAMFFNRIALLTQLRVLRVGDYNAATDHMRLYLFFSLGYGLNVLKSLGRNLVEFHMRDTGSLATEDISWMIAHWPHIDAGPAPFLKTYNNAKRAQVE